MFNNNHRTFYILGIGSITIGTLFFVYQNVFYEKHKMSKQTTIYIAKKDIPLNTELSRDLFEEVKIPQVAVRGKTIEDFSEVDGQFSKFSIAEGSILASTQISDDKLNKEGEFTVPLTGDFASNISVNDDVAVFVLLDKQGQKEVKKLFNSKRIYDKQFSTIDPIADDGEETTYYIKVTQYELQAYFEAMAQGEIIVAKRLYEYSPQNHFSNNFTGEFEASTDNLLEHFNPNWILEDESSSTVEPNTGSNQINNAEENDLATDNNSRGTVIYTTTSEDTWDTVASKFKTDITTLKTLNPTIVEIKADLILTVPAI